MTDERRQVWDRLYEKGGLESYDQENWLKVPGAKLRIPELDQKPVYRALRRIYPRAVLFFEDASEIDFRSGFIYALIAERGLTSHEDDIIYGLNRSFKALGDWYYMLEQEYQMKKDKLQRAKRMIHASSDAAIRFSMDYLNRWQMYKELFDRVSDPVQLELSFS